MQRPRTPLKVSESLHQRLNSYTLAASAAGVGMLALASLTEARIIYTPANVQIATGSPYNLDLNNDGITDFVLSVTTSSGKFYSFLNVKPAQSGNLIWGTTFLAAALHPGVNIRRSKKLGARHNIMCDNVSNSFPPWCGVQNRYLGLKFDVGGQVHYGWARLNAGFSNAGVNGRLTGLNGTLTGYAYETIPNKSIKTGKTHGPDVITLQDPSLGHLARGSSAIPAWREK
jgi:hypothetical protein